MNTTNSRLTRRSFLQGALLAPVGVALTPALAGQVAAATADAAPESTPVPTRKLGRNGPAVSMLIFGGDMPAYSPEHLDVGWSLGIRYFDTASAYGNGNDELKVAEWLTRYPERRKDLFLVSKNHPRQGPEQLLDMIDRRLDRCKTSYLDLYFIHGINPREYGQDSLDWPKSDVFKKVAEKLKSSGKVRMVGFSCHDDRAPEYLAAAAAGGFLDAIMVKYTPFYVKGGDFDKALDACHEAGIGLVAMKTLRNAADVPKRLPEFDKLGLTTHQALLQAVWSDPRITAVCNRMQNVDNIQTSVAAVRAYKGPLKIAEMELLKETMLANRRAICPGCPSCNQQGAALEFAFSDISRFVMYYEQDGDVGARDRYQELTAAQRDASTVDLVALREACHFKTDYPEIVRRAERYFA
ncbi:MAG TPA: aldo/keto reductase [Candidatus Acidoferrales bacterium]|nr:aldo/keto reductase [Candidatus Acidoferrales bacterium]